MTHLYLAEAGLYDGDVTNICLELFTTTDAAKDWARDLLGDKTGELDFAEELLPSGKREWVMLLRGEQELVDDDGDVLTVRIIELPVRESGHAG